MTEKQEHEQPKVETPKGNETKEEVVTIDGKYKTIYRKFDSEDMIRIRDKAVEVIVDENGKNRAVSKSGATQKLFIVLGVKQCPYFSDIIKESEGVTDEIFDRRYRTEFRKIPVSEMDKIFKAVQKYNNADFDPEVMQKN